MKHILVTGGCGFVGHHFANLVLKTTDWKISILDSLSYASRGMDRLQYIGALETGRVRVFPVDLARPLYKDVRKDIGDADYIVHFAAEVHVDRSIADPEKFIHSNVMGTFQMLQLAKDINLERFLYFSTDEVMGPSENGKLHKEWDNYNCTNPYSACKASGEELTLAWANTYNVPAIITHCTNVFGERQNPEAFIPATIKKILRGETISIHTNAEGKSGSRYYIYAEEVASAVLFLLKKEGLQRDKFNITGRQEISNLKLAELIAHFLNRTVDCELTSTDRPGCDFRYGLDGTKLREMGWSPFSDFYVNLEQVVDWYASNPKWLTRRSSAVFGGHQ